MEPCVYILLCSNKTYYTGVTSNLSQRINQHNSGVFKTCYTFSRRPVQLVFATRFSDMNTAIKYEKQIKNWSQSKKLALINGDYEKLPNLAKKNFK